MSSTTLEDLEVLCHIPPNELLSFLSRQPVDTKWPRAYQTLFHKPLTRITNTIKDTLCRRSWMYSKAKILMKEKEYLLCHVFTLQTSESI